MLLLFFYLNQNKIERTMAESESSVVNVFTNTVAPFSSAQLIGGTTGYVANEVAVSYMVRKMMGKHKSLFELAQVHALSVPLLGGAAGFMDPQGDFDDDWSTQFGAGIKGVPALFLAQYIIQIFNKGFSLPNEGFKEYLVAAFSKIVSRPVLSVINGYLPGQAADALQVLHNLVRRQAVASNLAGKSG